MARGVAAGEECRCGEYIGDEELLDKLLQDGSWQGGWQQEGTVECGRNVGRRSSLVGSLEDCSWQRGQQQE